MYMKPNLGLAGKRVIVQVNRSLPGCEGTEKNNYFFAFVECGNLHAHEPRSQWANNSGIDQDDA